MHNVWLIARREYVERVRTRGFLITTVMIPLIMGGFVFGSAFVNSRSEPPPTSPSSAPTPSSPSTCRPSCNSRGRSRPRSARQPRITVDAIDIGPQSAQATRAILDQELDSGDLDGYLWITPPATPAKAGPARPTFTFTPRSSDQDSCEARSPPPSAPSSCASSLPIAASPPPTPTPCSSPSTSSPPRPAPPRPRVRRVSVTILFFLMYFVIMLYGMNVARSIIEEKTSRIFEVMLATIRPEEMMAGKILGVGSVGLTQVGIWLTAALLLAAGAIAAHLGGQSIHVSLTAAQIVYFFVYFILGYAFYSSIAAALGAMTNSEQELQQLNMFLVLPLVVCFVTLGASSTTPTAPWPASSPSSRPSPRC